MWGIDDTRFDVIFSLIVATFPCLKRGFRGKITNIHSTALFPTNLVTLALFGSIWWFSSVFVKAQVFAIIYVATDVFKTSRSEPEIEPESEPKIQLPSTMFSPKRLWGFRWKLPSETHRLIYTEVFGENFLKFSPKIIEEIKQGILTKVFGKNYLIFSPKISSKSGAVLET